MKNNIYVDFKTARDFAQSLKLKGKSDWEQWVKSNEIPIGIPKSPSRTYAKQGWTNWGDFLGTNNKAPKNYEYVTFSEARTYVQALGIKNTKEWKLWCKSENKPINIPSNPQQAYSKKGWINYADFLGTKTAPDLSFTDAHKLVRSLGLKSRQEWHEWFEINRPKNLPKHPHHTYAEYGWLGWGDFLGTGKGPPTRKYRISQSNQFRSFEDAREYTRSLKLKSMTEWRKLIKEDALPSDIPSYPDQVYANDGWMGAGDFLGTGYIASIVDPKNWTG